MARWRHSIALLFAGPSLLAQPQFGPARIVHRIEPAERMVSTCDVDMDGDVDVLIAYDAPGSIGWYANDGQGGLSGRRSLGSVPDSITAFACADIDLDQDPDLVYAATSAQPLSIMFNSGGGIFTAPSPVSTTAAEVLDLAMVHLDDDLANDLAYLTSTGDVLIGLNNGFGEFTAPVNILSLPGAAHLKAADLNSDGLDDLLISSLPGGDITIMLNDGNGTFYQAPPLGASIGSPWWFTIGDPDGDGDKDVVAPGGDILWYANDGTAHFTPGAGYASSEQNAVCLDLNSDGRDEMLITEMGEYSTCDVRRLSLQADDEAVTSMATTLSCWGLREPVLADLDGDGVVDLVESLQPFNKVTWVAMGPGVFGTEHSFEGDAFLGPYDIEAADMDMDGDLDLATIAYLDRDVWFANDGSGNFELRTGAVRGNESEGWVRLGDMDGDSDPDLAHRAYAPDFFWSENQGGGVTAGNNPMASCEESSAIAQVGDVDSDGDNDILISPPSNVWGTQLYWLENVGAGHFGMSHIVSNDAPNVHYIHIVDVNGDGLNDIVCPLYDYPSGISVFIANGPGTFEPEDTTVYGDILHHAEPADIDGNGTLDMIAYALPNEGDDPQIVPFLNDGDGHFTVGTPMTIPYESHGRPIALGDLDHDSKVDLVFGEVDCACVRIFPGVGNGTFAAPILVDSTHYGGAIHFKLADLDLDDDLDIVTWRTNPTEIIWYENLFTSVSVPEHLAMASMNIAPNPLVSTAMITLPWTMASTGRLSVVDQLGRVVATCPGNGSDRIRMERNDLATGAYSLYCTNAAGALAIGKLMVW
jgi:hypothetical protein